MQEIMVFFYNLLTVPWLREVKNMKSKSYSIDIDFENKYLSVSDDYGKMIMNYQTCDYTSTLLLYSDDENIPKLMFTYGKTEPEVFDITNTLILDSDSLFQYNLMYNIEMFKNIKHKQFICYIFSKNYNFKEIIESIKEEYNV